VPETVTTPAVIVPPVVAPILTPAPSLPWWVLPGLAQSVLMVFAGALAASCFLVNETLRTQMFTGSLTLAATAGGYFFQSSNGSQRKDDVAAATSVKQAETIAAQGAALAVSTPVSTPTTTATVTAAGPGVPATAKIVTEPAPANGHPAP
jgi:hypothetical protein